ncbi:uncharacterized protein CTRU02_207766 [Colletotrichum truncatum]|uniref:Uncharacterized protein n=1 Tax=Colletotrichum truncatum TaxID=5467 RepID=A0ACC3Z1V1_COLTU|nr:uncharacterized protein CTRU02_09134 [Colletotrichum truncatum]KAF6788813.1 hypothetical protein CTRU02_09134 [Colletotrichum truncatum]
MTFDFEDYLKKLYSGSSFEITVLSGGLVNNTVRASKTSGDAEHESLILKYAPPYVASEGPEMPFSQKRQVIEALMLSLLNDASISVGNLASRSSATVTVPKLIHHDPELHILILEDLGPLITLWETFLSQPSPLTVSLNLQPLGRRVGRFFAHLHRPSLPSSVRSAWGDRAVGLENSFTDDLVFEAAVQPVLERLKQQDIPNAEQLYERIVEDYRRPKYTYTPRMAMGDFHTGSILTNALADPSAADEHLAAVIDWEFASINGRGVNGDMAQFLAWVHCFLLSLSPGDERGRLVAEGFVRGLCAAYAEESGLDLAAAEEETRQLLRSALILHGRQMINEAFDWDWKVGGPKVAEMVRVGAWHVQVAGEGVEDMMGRHEVAEALGMGMDLPRSMVFDLFTGGAGKKD